MMLLEVQVFKNLMIHSIQIWSLYSYLATSRPTWVIVKEAVSVTHANNSMFNPSVTRNPVARLDQYTRMSAQWGLSQQSSNSK